VAALLVRCRSGLQWDVDRDLVTRGIELNDWLLTEALRRREQRQGRWRDDAAAVRLAREAEGGLEHRLAVRARAVPGLVGVGDDLLTLARSGRRFLLSLGILGVMTGWLAARASVADRQMDLLLASLTLVGLPSLLLLLWLLVWCWGGRSRGSGGVLTAMVDRLLAWLGPRFLTSTLAPELAQSAAAWLVTRAGRWWLSLGSHLLWLAYAAGALLGLLFHFSVAQYDLSWGTTILSEQNVANLIQALAWLPERLGLGPAMTLELIERGRVGGLAGADRSLWARFLMLLVALYVALPRLLLVVLSWWRFRRQARGLKLNLGQPGYLRLKAELMPDADTHKTLGAMPEDEPDRSPRSRPTPAGRPVLVGFELDGDADARIAGAMDDRVIHLGSADRRKERQALVQALEAMRPPPSDLLVVCSLLRTPDSGGARFINRLADAARSALTLLVVDGEQVESRGGDLAARLADWQRLAVRAGGRLQAISLRQDPDTVRARVVDALEAPGGEA